MNVERFKTTEEWVEASVNFIAEICRKKGDEPTKIALSGGSTPRHIYAALAEREDIPFENVEFYQVDERYVPHDNPNSNYKLIYHDLVAPIKERLKGFYWFDPGLSIDGALSRYEALIRHVNRFDLVILGVGPDGHIASLFPESDALFEKERLVAHSTTTEFAVRDRLTITLPTIMKSRQLLVLLRGPEKQRVLDKLLHGDLSDAKFPAKALVPHNEITLYFGEV